MNNDNLAMPSLDQLPQAAKDITRLATDAAREAAHRTTAAAKEYTHEAIDATKDAAHRATDAAKDLYQSASAKAEDALASSKEYVRQNPFPVIFGALALGAVIGCVIGLTHREEPTFRQRFFR